MLLSEEVGLKVQGVDLLLSSLFASVSLQRPRVSYTSRDDALFALQLLQGDHGSNGPEHSKLILGLTIGGSLNAIYVLDMLFF